MKVNLTIRMQLVLDIPDHLDPALHSHSHWRTTCGHFARMAGPGATDSRHPSKLQPFVEAAKHELAAIIAEHGVDALSGSVQIVLQPVPQE